MNTKGREMCGWSSGALQHQSENSSHKSGKESDGPVRALAGDDSGGRARCGCGLGPGRLGPLGRGGRRCCRRQGRRVVVAGRVGVLAGDRAGRSARARGQDGGGVAGPAGGERGQRRGRNGRAERGRGGVDGGRGHNRRRRGRRRRGRRRRQGRLGNQAAGHTVRSRAVSQGLALGAADGIAIRCSGAVVARIAGAASIIGTAGLVGTGVVAVDGVVRGGAGGVAVTAGGGTGLAHAAVGLSGRVAAVVTGTEAEEGADGLDHLGLVRQRLGDDLRGDGQEGQDGGRLEQHGDDGSVDEMSYKSE